MLKPCAFQAQRDYRRHEGSPLFEKGRNAFRASPFPRYRPAARSSPSMTASVIGIPKRTRQRLGPSDCAGSRFQDRARSPPRRPRPDPPPAPRASTSPAACASVRSMSLPDMNSGRAWPLADARHDIGADGRRDQAKPRFRQPEPCALSAAIAASQTHRRPMPPPKALPWTRAISGFPNSFRAWNIGRQPPCLGHPLVRSGIELRAHPAKIAAGAKACALSRQHHDPDRRSALERRATVASVRRSSRTTAHCASPAAQASAARRPASSTSTRSVSSRHAALLKVRAQRPRPAASFSSARPVA